jgi:N,N'-diacetyllegionaminate synthase
MSPLVIAEAGVNHNGDLGRARDMVHAAAAAGADYVKFQAFSAEGLVARGARTAPYQAANTGEADQRALLRGLEIGIEGFAVLAEACRAHRIGFMATAFDVEMVEALLALGMDRIKIASGELTNAPSLERFARLGKPVLLSTGMATLDEVGQAVDLLRANGAADITLLQCTSLYPAPPAALNLRAMQTMARHFGLPVGFSDHSPSDHAAVAAVALGADVIEKHFTLDRGLPGPDHAASLEPSELAAMIAKLREIGAMLGDGVKAPTHDELATAALVRRSWHAARDLPAGTVIAADAVVLKRPASGLAPEMSPVGRTLIRAVAADAPLTAADLAAPRFDKAAV